MVDLWTLPTTIDIDGTEYPIRTDFRAVISVLCCFSDPDFDDLDKIIITLDALVKDFETMPQELWAKAYEQVMAFIDMGQESESSGPRLMDWEQDAPIIIPSINKVLGKEIRSLDYMHWWTFLGAYMEIGQGLFSNVVSIRNKKAKNIKLEKDEQTFYRENKKLIDLKPRLTDEEKAQKEYLNNLLK